MGAHISKIQTARILLTTIILTSSKYQVNFSKRIVESIPKFCAENFIKKEKEVDRVLKDTVNPMVVDLIIRLIFVC